jgi:hypothetical protein
MSKGHWPHAVGQDGPHTTTASRELFRYAKAGRIRAYNLKALDGERAELWVVSRGAGSSTKSRKLLTFGDLEDANLVLRDIERELRQGGWFRI